jgi:hypothetical protein
LLKALAGFRLTALGLNNYVHGHCNVIRFIHTLRFHSDLNFPAVLERPIGQRGDEL